MQNLHNRPCDLRFLKKPENMNGFCEVLSWWVPHWVKFRIFSSLEHWNRHFRDKITKKFYCGGRYNPKLNYLKLMAINCTIQPLLFNINKWNLKVLISGLLFFVVFFCIRLHSYGFGNMLEETMWWRNVKLLNLWYRDNVF